MSGPSKRSSPESRGSAIAWSGLVLLLVIGIVAAFARATHVGTLAATVEPVRDGFLSVFGIAEQDPARRAVAVATSDRNFGTHAFATLLHVGSGALLFLLVPLQFSKAVRARYLAVHRWSGRLLVATAWVVGSGALFFGVLHPFAGMPERVIVGAIGSWFLACISMGYVMARRGGTTRHRQWMVRAVAAALSVSTIRLVAFPMDAVLTRRGMTPEAVLVWSFALGWVITLVGAEWWLRRTAIVRPVPA